MDSLKPIRQTDRGIQLLRIIACIAVFICHFGQRMELWNINDNFFNLSQLGSYGVQLFFVISGYLACFSLSEGKSVIDFYKKRAIRLLPLYYFCILYYFITETFLFKDIPADPQHLGWLRYLFCLNGIVPSDGYFWGNIGITWTIPVFVLFYLLAPLIVRFAKKTWVIVILLIGAIGLAFVIKQFVPGWLSAFTYLPCFLFGILVYCAKKDNKRFIVLILLLIFAIVFKWIEWIEFGDIITGIITDKIVISSLFAAMIIISEQFTVSSKRIIRTLDILDEHSYTLYLIHGIIFCGIIDKFEFNIYLRIAIAVFGTLILTILVHKFIEKPVQRFLYNRFFHK